MQELKLKKIAEGREAEIYAYGDGRVLRLFRDPAAAGWLQREIVAMRAVRSVVPLVPEVYETVELMGRPGIVMERIDGPDLLTRIGSKPWTVWSGGALCGDVHARIHDVAAPPEIESLTERVSRLAGRDSLVPDDILHWARSRFDEMPDGDRLLHGDFHPGNILLAATGPVVIDWPNVTRGHPDADLARSLLILRVGAVPPGTPLVVRYGQTFARGLVRMSYERAYRRRRPYDAANVAKWLPLRAVDRLGDNIPEERPALLAIIKSAITQTPGD